MKIVFENLFVFYFNLQIAQLKHITTHFMTVSKVILNSMKILYMQCRCSCCGKQIEENEVIFRNIRNFNKSTTFFGCFPALCTLLCLPSFPILLLVIFILTPIRVNKHCVKGRVHNRMNVFIFFLFFFHFADTITIFPTSIPTRLPACLFPFANS